MSKVRIKLRGGPEGLAGQQRDYWAPAEEFIERIRIPFRGGYEHFELVHRAAEGTSDSASPTRIYEWSYRTTVAE